DLGIGSHRSKFVNAKVLAPKTHPRLAKEDRPRRGKPDHQQHKREKRKEQQQTDCRRQRRHKTPGYLLRRLHAKSLAIDEAARMQTIQVELAGQPLEKVSGFFNHDAVKSQLEKFVHWKLAATILERDDDAVDSRLWPGESLQGGI